MVMVVMAEVIRHVVAVCLGGSGGGGDDGGDEISCGDYGVDGDTVGDGGDCDGVGGDGGGDSGDGDGNFWGMVVVMVVMVIGMEWWW
ncbi:hypothetical protein DPMN_111860 [Dreissena polymorpha]|uniref:Uncharacterized protein n=1 Tax=Dreissena polymorpha TaxID=45954 RepID=A0A9D4KFZ6_DREPO|nr:hypothetical protein DPMN_111860 [Dreissena polymorpha]